MALWGQRRRILLRGERFRLNKYLRGMLWILTKPDAVWCTGTRGN